VPKADINSGITPTEKPQHLAGAKCTLQRIEPLAGKRSAGNVVPRQICRISGHEPTAMSSDYHIDNNHLLERMLIEAQLRLIGRPVVGLIEASNQQSRKLP